MELKKKIKKNYVHAHNMKYMYVYNFPKLTLSGSLKSLNWIVVKELWYEGVG